MMHVDQALARRLELTQTATLVEYVETAARLYPALGCGHLPLAGGAHAIYAGPGSPISRAAGLGLCGPVAAEVLEQAEDFFQVAGDVPQVDLCPLAHPSLVDFLGNRGYRVRWCLNVHFQEVGRHVVRDAGQGECGSIRVVSGEACDIDVWARTVSDGFEGVDRPALVHPSIAFVTGQKPGVVRFLAYAGSEPAGAAALDMRDGLAIFYSTSTRMRFRGKGVHAALLRARLSAAVEAGCDLAMVLTGPGAPSQRNVERAGFRTAYTVMRMIR
ncbi:MAG: hypothetical protein Q8P50_02850 [Bacillota bacterium]|nr:hypothetical protein [Bacillota bacterium]